MATLYYVEPIMKEPHFTKWENETFNLIVSIKKSYYANGVDVAHTWI